jgi:hypothetical protein
LFPRSIAFKKGKKQTAVSSNNLIKYKECGVLRIILIIIGSTAAGTLFNPGLNTDRLNHAPDDRFHPGVWMRTGVYEYFSIFNR